MPSVKREITKIGNVVMNVQQEEVKKSVNSKGT